MIVGHLEVGEVVEVVVTEKEEESMVRTGIAVVRVLSGNLCSRVLSPIQGVHVMFLEFVSPGNHKQSGSQQEGKWYAFQY